MPSPIPFARLRTLFLDVGNTLLSMNYPFIRDELAKLDLEVTLESLMRAEAKARPVVSRAVAEKMSTEGSAIFELYLATTVGNAGCPAGRERAIVDAVAPILRRGGPERLWTYVLPGVPEALEELNALGLDLAVVSNSDGSVERLLVDQGLRPYVSVVFDSHVVGFEKPDPRIFLHALEHMGASGDTTLHLGDLYAADVVGARAAGLHGALVDPYGDWEGVDCERFTGLPGLAAALRANVA